MSAEINRLGFGAWGENIIVNYLEDHNEELCHSLKGSHVIEKEEYSLKASWEDKVLCISIRAWVKGEGWQFLEQQIAIK